VSYVPRLKRFSAHHAGLEAVTAPSLPELRTRLAEVCGGAAVRLRLARSRRRRRWSDIGAAALPAVSRTTRAQSYPSRPVKIIVGQAAGSASDLIARLIAQFLSEKLGQQFLVEVRPGAAGKIATEAVTRMPPDGYTLLLVNSQNAINVALYEKLGFDFVRDIAPVGRPSEWNGKRAARAKPSKLRFSVASGLRTS
jgi:hypothetical protein